MKTSTIRSTQRTRRTSLRPSVALLEPLEQRQHFSAWTTASSDPSQNEVISMASDRFGNVYALDDWNGTIRKSSDAGANWATIAKAPASATYNSLAVDAEGDLFVTARGVGSDGKPGHWQVLELPVGQTALSVVDDVPSGNCIGLAIDGAGDAFAIGQVTVTTSTTTRGKTTTSSTVYNTVREKLLGQNVFSTVQVSTSMTFNAITAIDGGASAGVYVAGKSNNAWGVLKSSNLGQSWSMVDQTQSPTGIGTTTDNNAYAVVGDSSGNVFVAGQAVKGDVTGYTKNRTPIYSYRSHWVVRKSGNGGASWTVDDDYQLSSSRDAYFQGIGTDLAGHVYAVGAAYDSSNHLHAIVRTNADGGWATSDNYAGASGYGGYYYCFTADSNGNLYVGGQDDDATWLIRTTSGPTATATLAST